MASTYIITSLLVLSLTTDVRTQFFDFLQGLQSFSTHQTNIPKSFNYDQTTLETKSGTNKQLDKEINEIRPVVSIQPDEPEGDGYTREKKRKTTLDPIFSLFTTPKPLKKPTKVNSSRKNSGSNENHKKNQALRVPNDSNRRLDRTEALYDEEGVNKINNGFDAKNYFTTQSPLLNRPGVRPAAADNNLPPITNRPSYSVNPRPNDAGAIAFPDDPNTPEVLTGMDEDNMSQAEKRRYIDVAERMCDKYKALNMKQVQAIPLVPSPEPVAVNVSSCTPTTVPLVVGGKVVTIKEFPHMALLGWVKTQAGGYSWKCGGSLISDQYILTAAHCAYQERDISASLGPPRAAQLGSSYLDDPGALVVKVDSVIRHPKYKQPRSYYDIALVKLRNTVRFSEVIKPACLGVPPEVGSPIIATGWGRTEFGGDQSLELRSVSLPVWDMNECAEVLGTSRKLPNGPLPETQICAGEKRGGKDTCQGDSGGPAQVQDGCVWRVVAVTSLGRSCGAPHTPGLYARAQRAFIAAHVFGGQKNTQRDNNQQNMNTNQQSKNTAQQNRNTNQQNRNTNQQNRNTNQQNRNTDQQNRNTGHQNRNTNQQNYNNNDGTRNDYSSRNDNRRGDIGTTNNDNAQNYNRNSETNNYDATNNYNNNGDNYGNDYQRQRGYNGAEQDGYGTNNNGRDIGTNYNNRPRNGNPRYSNDNNDKRYDRPWWS